jgi:hypothetical protein
MFTGGWKQIDGKWYYFHSDGSMAVNTTIDGYTIGSDGARKQDGKGAASALEIPEAIQPNTARR